MLERPLLAGDVLIRYRDTLKEFTQPTSLTTATTPGGPAAAPVAALAGQFNGLHLVGTPAPTATPAAGLVASHKGAVSKTAAMDQVPQMGQGSASSQHTRVSQRYSSSSQNADWMSLHRHDPHAPVGAARGTANAHSWLTGARANPALR